MGKGFIQISLTLIILILISFNCSKNKKKPKENQQNSISTNTIPDSEIYNFSYKYTKGKEVIWELYSDKAEVYKKNDLIKITGVYLTFFKNSKPDTTVVSKYGEVKQQIKLLTAISNVILHTSDGTTLYTDLLNWDDNRRKLFTDKYVKIVRENGDIIEGIGMEADNNLERLEIKQNVKGTVYEKNK